MKFMFVIDHLGPGGAQRQLVEQCNMLVDNGFHVYVFTYRYIDSPYHLNNSVVILRHNIPGGLIGNIQRIVLLRMLIKNNKPDWVVSFLDIPALITYISSRFLPCKTCSSKRSSLSKLDLSFPVKYIWKVIYRANDAVMCNSFAVKNMLASAYKLKIEKIHYINNVFNFDNKNQITYSSPNCVESVITKNDCRAIKVVCVGRLVRSKNPLIVAESIVHSAKKGKMIHVYWYGEIIDKSLKDQIDSLLFESHLSDAWFWMGVDPNIQSILQEYDLMVHMSKYEGMPNAVIEASAAGLFILMSNIPPHIKLIEQGMIGRILSSQSPIDLSDALCEIESEIDFYKRIAKSNPSFVRMNFSNESAYKLLKKCLSIPEKSYD